MTNERDFAAAFGETRGWIFNGKVYLLRPFRSFGALINRRKGEMSFELIKLPDEWLINFGRAVRCRIGLCLNSERCQISRGHWTAVIHSRNIAFRQLSIRKKIRFNAVPYVHANFHPDVIIDTTLRVMKIGLAEIMWRGLEMIW